MNYKRNHIDPDAQYRFDLEPPHWSALGTAAAAASEALHSQMGEDASFITDRLNRFSVRAMEVMTVGTFDEEPTFDGLTTAMVLAAFWTPALEAEKEGHEAADAFERMGEEIEERIYRVDTRGDDIPIPDDSPDTSFTDIELKSPSDKPTSLDDLLVDEEDEDEDEGDEA